VAQLFSLGIVAFMNTRQLTNVLIKVLGLSLIAHGIPAIISMAMTTLIEEGMGARTAGLFPSWVGQIAPVATLIIGIILIVASRSIADFLFRNDDNP